MIRSATKLYITCTNKLVNQIRHASTALPRFTSEVFDIKRKQFGSVQSADINYFESILSKDRVLKNDDDVLPFNVDWLKSCRGQSKVVLKPKTTEEVSRILSYCNDKHLAVCPQGGNTSVSGGAVPVFDEIILNFTLMNNIVSLDEISGALVCEAGCILENLDKYAREHNLIMPLDLGAKGTCQIGGNISTNAGGLRLLRYGNLHGTVLGIEAVKADGTVIDCLRTLKKDNTGYHLKHLFIGSEGTLGVVTKVAIHCPAMPKAISVGFFGLENFENVLQLYKNAKLSLGEILSAFELVDDSTLNCITRNMGYKNPISEYPFYVLIETHGSDEAHDEEKLSKFLTQQINNNTVLDGLIATEPSKIQAIWNLRESAAPAAIADGFMYSYDITLPLKHYYDIIPLLRQRLADKVISVSGCGHIGDGNLHIIVTTPKYIEEVTAVMEPFIYEEVAKLRGSVSAEHGIGIHKLNYVSYSKDKSAIQLMRQIKHMMDPHGILNPYKVLTDV